MFTLLAALISGCGGGGGGSTGTTATQTSTSAAGTTASTSTTNAGSTATPTPTPAATPTPATTPTPAPTPAATPDISTTNPGAPIPTLTTAEAAQFQAAIPAFTRTPRGLGPIFNNNSCVSCHGNPDPGGSSRQRVTRFGSNAGGVFDDLAALGGSLLQDNAIPGTPREVVPNQANVTAQRRTTPLFGDGLIEAIPDSAIIAYAQQQAQDHPAQAGQVNFVTSASDGQQHVGRFGWKCQQALLLDFSGDAFINEMGISNALFPFENQPNAPSVGVGAAQLDDQPDGNGVTLVARGATFMRFLAPIRRGALDADGAALFESIGCAVCHNPSFTTVSPIAALDGQTIAAFSDFLLHDVGTGDGIVQGNAPANKLRTAPLMGVGTQPFYLHDGSANTVDGAIRRHAVEAASASSAYQALTPDQRAALLRYVQAL